jgi:dipeptidyl aminopeptidase/acylaminoacyl peptidase
MKLKTIACLALVALCTSTPVNAASVAAYAAGPAVNNVRLSPDGKMIAFSTHKGDEPHVIVQTLDDRKLVADILLAGVDINDVRWAGSKQLLVMTVQDDEISGITDGNHVMVQSIDLASRKATDLLRDQQSVINVLQGPPVVRVNAEGVAKALLIAPNMVGSFALSLYETDLSNGRSKLLGRGDSDVRDWQVGRDGNPLAQIKYDRETRRWQVAEKRRPHRRRCGADPEFPRRVRICLALGRRGRLDQGRSSG